MNYPKKVYAIYPFDEDGRVVGVYVGSAGKVNERLNLHLYDKAVQKELHRLMKENGYTFQILDDIPDVGLRHIEYDWVDFFLHSNAKVFNSVVSKGNWERIVPKYFYPVWNGKGVVWCMKPRQRPGRPTKNG